MWWRWWRLWWQQWLRKWPWIIDENCRSNWKTSNLKYVFEIPVIMNSVFCCLDKSNLYFVIGKQLVFILCNWNTFLCKILKVTKITLQLFVLDSNLVRGTMFQPVFAVFLCTVYRTDTVTVSIPSLEMCLFLLFIKWIWWTRNESWLYFVFRLLSLKAFCILGYLFWSNWQK